MTRTQRLHSRLAGIVRWFAAESSRPASSRRSRLATVTGVLIGTTMATGVAFAASNWTVGLTAGSSANAQAASVSNISIAQITPVSGVTNQLYPGGNGDIQLKITNTNVFPVTITAIAIPSTQATGYTNSDLSTGSISGCSSSNSTVTWVGSAGSHTLTTALTVGASGAANNPLTVTLTNEAAMGSSAPSACVGAYFSMPSLTGITATGGAATLTTSPATDTYS